MTAPSLRAVASAATSAATTSLTINVPAGTQNNDGLILGIMVRGGSGVTVSTPAGWTSVLAQNQGTGVRLAIFSRVASSEPANYTVSWTGGSFNASGGIYAAQGSSTSALVNASGSQGNAASTSAVAPSITTTVNDCLLLFIGGAQATPTWTAPGGETERWDTQSTSGSTEGSSTCAEETFTTAGATGTRTATLSASQNNVGALVALAPASGSTFSGSGAPALPALTGAGAGTFTAASTFTGGAAPSLPTLTGAGAGTFAAAAAVLSGSGVPALTIRALMPLLFAPGTNGAPQAASPIGVPELDSYEHSIVATGGFESARWGFTAPWEQALAWLGRLMSQAIVYGPDGEIVWEGFLEAVEVGLGQESRSRTLRGMANRMRSRYTTVLDTPGVTPTASDATSQARYGIVDGVLSLPRSTAAAAASLRDKELARRKNPIKGGNTTIATGDLGDVHVTLSFSGWYYALARILTANSATSTAVTTAQIATLLAAYNAVQPYFSTVTADIAASGVSETQYIAPDTSYLDKIESLLAIGNSAGQRLAWGVYAGRRFRVAQWAGATPNTIAYRRYLGDAFVYGPGHGVIMPWNVRPDAMYEVVDLLDVSPVTAQPDAAAHDYIERVTFSASGESISLTIEPQQSDALDAQLARLHA